MRSEKRGRWTYWFVQKQATAVMLEQFTCATASVRQFITTLLEAWGVGGKGGKRSARE